MSAARKTKLKTRTPLKDRPLRNPGQSVREARLDMAYDKLLAPMLMALFLSISAMLEWWRYFFPSSPSPTTITVIAVFALLYMLWQFRKYWPKVTMLRLAEDGEKAVGQFLERLREQGYVVFHDVVGIGFNVDHVIVGPAGVFTVETKTWKKPDKGDARVVFDGEQLTANGFAPDRDPVIQAKAQARWVRDVLLESTGRSLAVWPVVLFPGWFIENTRESFRDIWVLEPKALPKFLQNEKQKMAAEDVTLVAMHLGLFIRAQERAFDEKR